MLLDANIFQPLINVFAAVLKFFHHDLGLGWGLAIVLLTVCVRVLLVPLGMRQFHSMQRMAMHMPEMKKIRERYKDNPQRMQQETMKFYKENNINPFSSCVPLLIQWPFLIGLFWTLRGNLRIDICPTVQRAFQEKYVHAHGGTLAHAAGQTVACGTPNAHFLFINDLTNKPHGIEVAILLVLYVGTSIGSSMIMMMPGTDQKQRRLMLFLPVIFAVVTIRFPSGALLYYIIFNLWMVIQQSVFKQLIGKQYRHPEGAAIGVHDGGSISSGGGLKGLFGLNAKPDDDDFDEAGTAGAAASSGRGAPGGAQHGRGAKQATTGADRPRGGATAVSEPKGAQKARSGSRDGTGSAGKRSGASKTDSGVGKGKGTAGSDADGATRAPGSAPPPPPRKRKKRSGRRR